MTNKRIAVGVLGFFALFALFNNLLLATGQNAVGKLIGFVYKSDKKTPLDEAKVILVDTLNGSRYESNITDDNGDYKIENLPDGNYFVYIEIKDREFKVKKLDFIVKIKDGKVSYLSFAINRSLAPIIIIPVGAALAYSIGSTLFIPDPDPASPTIR